MGCTLSASACTLHLKVYIFGVQESMLRNTYFKEFK